MRKIFIPSFLLIIFGCFLLTVSWADESMPSFRNPPSGYEAFPMKNEQPTDNNSALATSLYDMSPQELVKHDINDASGKSLGKIIDVISNRRNKQLYTLVSSGGFLGIGADKYVVPLQRLAFVEGKIYARNDTKQPFAFIKYQANDYVSIAPVNKHIVAFASFEAPMP